ncbi:mitochondrial carrier [Tilletiaria anomala UBC 951]|uniref:Mitochondrial carrier n=1 Tax=Tilletiaria anomala (strain ATCC 24038 / CBS 436.72 / UBC 951) TaxID=1037660 RepID=A0A066VT69_TILAU|nr:mitochondrial carrier [Tilletiaria anomala UBC 951]KDN44897.1 mitochondrial carrier [Tilletiaria anomala UBC 951]
MLYPASQTWCVLRKCSSHRSHPISTDHWQHEHAHTIIHSPLEPESAVHNPYSSSEHPRKFSQATRDVAFGSIAGMFAKLFEHPFDLVKVRLQTQQVAPAPSSTSPPLAATPHYRGALHCFSSTYANEGVRGLYRGLSMPVLGAVAENATLFFTYNAILRLLAAHTLAPLGATEGKAASAKPEDMNVSQLAIAAAGAGAVTSLVLTPVELIKCRMQVQMISASAISSSAAAASASLPVTAAPAQIKRLNPTNLQGPLEILTSTIRTEGVRGLWLGQTGTLLRETGGGIAWFLTFELVTRRMVEGIRAALAKKDLSSLQLITAGALAGISYNLVLFPADSVKSTMQTEKELGHSARGTTSGKEGRTSFMNTFRKIYNTKGVKGLYAGCGITCLRSAPSSALIL